MKHSSMTRLLVWERLAAEGDFSAMPKPFTWDQSDRFAHFLNGYDVAGGLDRLAGLSNAMSAQFRKTGQWQGTVLDLWLCLYFQHRARRHMGLEDSDPRLDDLCEALRAALSQLSLKEAKLLVSGLGQNVI
ncbi:hypothetical protein EH240_31300 [Mesorhizobium tamadayense]|uniref:Uncharacterized protein n=1 Tax=Mesorhizobium tamadayense TaxID=425306 RepID=A0A3P3F1T5_9HYPH|nr:hypothetical protein [Mesorhizobium tamadayense]RRH92072.1 hypothetical protein EH240_31300 [Mesorhizobium tamadayense]